MQGGVGEGQTFPLVEGPAWDRRRLVVPTESLLQLLHGEWREGRSGEYGKWIEGERVTVRGISVMKETV